MNAPSSYADLLQRTKIAPPVGARQVTGAATVDDTPAAPPAPNKETAMPKGVYNRSKKKEGAAPPKAKKARVPRKKKAAADVGALALEALIAAGAHLADTVREQVEELEDCVPLAQALRSYELAVKIHGAAGG